ncbi:AraC family transcriptional regulator [Klebsiella pneumoniae]|uniref:AraC family transcriptional regulator n=1 Tax=Klebsiella pneumoniae TaxID=573 RepID=A0A377ZRF1_KLEPN|nr:AraC family transcriptional regulator [Klebsiella pneumoniae]
MAAGASNSTCSISHHGALFPLVDAFRSRSGPDAEDYQWLMHQARPALSVDEARLDGYWLRIDSLQSNALALYEFTPQSPTAP